MTSFIVALVLSASGAVVDQAPTADVTGNRVNATGSTTPRALGDRFGDVVSVKDLGAKGDGTTDDTSAVNALAARGGRLFTAPTNTAYRYGKAGPAFGVVARTDVATPGAAEKLTNGGFTGADGWTLSNFSHRGNGISHGAGAPGSATQTISMSPYKQYRLSVTIATTAKGDVAFAFGGVPLLDPDLAAYIFDVAPAATYVFNVELRTVANSGSAPFSITTDKAWAGSIQAVSLVEVADELPLAFEVISADDATARNPHGLKFGRFNAGQYFLGDRQTGAFHLSAGVWNVGIGARALSSNETGFENTAVGSFALKYTGSARNVAVGYGAGKMNTRGEKITALGFKALFLNTIGNYNTGVGFHSGFQNTSGSQNTSVGYQALYDGYTDSYQTAVGSQAGLNARGGNANTYVGALAGMLSSDANVTYGYAYTTSLGAETKAYGDRGTAVGFQARVGADGAAAVTNSVAVGAGAVADRSNMAQIGDPSVTVLRLGTHSITWSAAPPTSGTWARGDVAYNSAAAVGHPQGWMCTVPGTPGTWVSMGNL